MLHRNEKKKYNEFFFPSVYTQYNWDVNIQLKNLRLIKTDREAKSARCSEFSQVYIKDSHCNYVSHSKKMENRSITR